MGVIFDPLLLHTSCFWILISQNFCCYNKNDFIHYSGKPFDPTLPLSKNSLLVCIEQTGHIFLRPASSQFLPIRSKLETDSVRDKSLDKNMAVLTAWIWEIWSMTSLTSAMLRPEYCLGLKYPLFSSPIKSTTPLP